MKTNCRYGWCQPNRRPDYCCIYFIADYLSEQHRVSNAEDVLAHADGFCAAARQYRSAGDGFFKGVGVGHAQLRSFVQLVAEAKGQMILNHARRDDVEGHVAAADRLLVVAKAAAQGQVLRVRIIDAKLIYVDIAPAESRSVVGAERYLISRRITDRGHAGIIDALIIESHFYICNGLDSDAQRIGFRDVERALFGEQTFVFVELAHLHFGRVRNADADHVGQLSIVAEPQSSAG